MGTEETEKKVKKKKILALAACALIGAGSLGSCGGGDRKGGGEGHMYGAALASNPESLDPQFANEPSSATVIKNLYSGLMMKDKDGNIVVTRLDEDTLQQIAAAGGGAYVHAGNEEFGLNPIINDLRRLEAETFNSVVFEEYDEQYMYFFAVALVLLVIEMLIGSRRWKRRMF